jgi:nitrogenase molybdenum-iron protein beta chain
MVLSRHFKEAAVASSSSFTEGASVFGGRSNINTAVKNVFDMYNPDIIAVHTTCLSETIGDDLNSYITDMKIPDGKTVVHCNTPSYVGSHINGYFNMMTGFMTYLTQKTGTSNGKTAIFPGWVNPGDIRELKRITQLLAVPTVFFPDQSGVMDAPMTGSYTMFPEGGTTLEEIRGLGDSNGVIALGEIIGSPPAEHLRKKFKVPYTLLPTPIGVTNTDRFVLALRQKSQTEVPQELDDERGRLVDLLLDSHQYTYQKKVALFGDPDMLLGLTSFILEMGMIPKYVITGTPQSDFVYLAEALFSKYGVTDCTVKAGADLFLLHQWIKNEPVDLMIGTTYGKQIARAEDIPFIRAGFPVIDRYGGPLLPIVGYSGGIMLAEKIINALLDRFDRDADDEDFEIVL